MREIYIYSLEIRSSYRHTPGFTIQVPLSHNRPNMSLNLSSCCEVNDCCYSYYPNGTWGPTGLPDLRNQECQCPFPGNADIAGPGVSSLCPPVNVTYTDISKVMAAFITTAWITCWVAGTNVCCELSKKADKYLSSYESTNRAENFECLLWSILPLRASRDFATSSSCFASCIRVLVHLCCKGVNWILWFHAEPATRMAAKSALDILCDIQVVTGTAIMIAGIVQRDSSTFYHQQIVMNYWFLALNSFWAARAGNLNNNVKDDDWHYWTRLVAIFATNILSIYYQLATIPRQHNAWNSLNSGFCFVSHDKSAYGQNYLWAAGLILFTLYLFFVLLAGATSASPTWMDRLSKATDRFEKKCHKNITIGCILSCMFPFRRARNWDFGRLLSSLY
jgi:hypothetical protein